VQASERFFHWLVLGIGTSSLPDSILVLLVFSAQPTPPNADFPIAIGQGLLMLRVHGKGARSCGQPASLERLN